MLLAALTAADSRRRLNFWAGDVSWIMYVSPLAESWTKTNEELPPRVRQTIGVTKSILTVFFNLKEFATVGL
jgi:hypothetical protein